MNRGSALIAGAPRRVSKNSAYCRLFGASQFKFKITQEGHFGKDPSHHLRQRGRW
ncbi:hypothetical protein SAMN05216198_2209 [Halopseudomonas litoralis]|uniref:Uncharacterized protein n=1 Tax=Halopseudomonas litoralis TaxID=797277 RepID=A0A1H1T5C5_9GAMM|nr:hypothetical protein SAMN05216198_2209 [Halopseudomonas litoralis]